MAKLSEEQKLYIVEGHARFMTPQEIREGYKERFGSEVTPQQVTYYNPTTVQGSATLGEKWCELFYTLRESVKYDIAMIPIANAAYRLRRLDRMARAAEDRGNFRMASALLAQASDEAERHYVATVNDRISEALCAALRANDPAEGSAATGTRPAITREALTDLLDYAEEIRVSHTPLYHSGRFAFPLTRKEQQRIASEEREARRTGLSRSRYPR